MDKKSNTEDSLNDLEENTEGSKEVMSKTRQGLSVLEIYEIADQARNSINVTDESEDNIGSNPIGIKEKIDFKAIFEQCTVDVHKIMDKEIENINLKLATIFESCSEENSEKINIEDVPVKSAEDSEIVHQETVSMTEDSKSFPEPSFVGCSEIIDQETDGMTNELKDFPNPNYARFNVVMDQENDGMTEASKVLAEPSVARFTKVMDMISEEVNKTTNRVSSNEDDGEIMHQAIECVTMPGTSKIITTFNAEKVDETSNPNEFTTESLENLESVNTEEKVNSGPKRKTRKRKAPPISDMVLASIKKIKRSDGVSFEDIKKHMEENYPVKVKALVKYHVSNYLKKFVDKGLLVKTDGADSERFIINEFMEI